MTFDGAVELCNSSNATLARVSNREEFDFVTNEIIQELNLSENDLFWIGKATFITRFFLNA